MKKEILTIQPAKYCKRDKKKELEFQQKVENLFNEYKNYPMLAVQNCQFTREKVKGIKDCFLNFPDKDACFYIAYNVL